MSLSSTEDRPLNTTPLATGITNGEVILTLANMLQEY